VAANMAMGLERDVGINGLHRAMVMPGALKSEKEADIKTR